MPEVPCTRRETPKLSGVGGAELPPGTARGPPPARPAGERGGLPPLPGRAAASGHSKRSATGCMTVCTSSCMWG